ncbi:MAG TPA: GNAT family N-acetyltransferase [Acidimicrobiales bacterium]|nr:GNAT family N-acetyltransferase [Acidimicrobiales bacterium]
MRDIAGGSRSEVVLSVVPLDHRQVRDLESAHVAEMAARYGGGGPGPVHGREFEPPDGCFVLASIGDTPVGCGGFRRLGPGVAEIKRMFVAAGARGSGVGRRVLVFLEEQARAAGYRESWLETGTEQPEAIALYTSAGYRPIDPYGEFRDDARCRCFARTLGPRVTRGHAPGRRARGGTGPSGPST